MLNKTQQVQGSLQVFFDVLHTVNSFYNNIWYIETYVHNDTPQISYFTTYLENHLCKLRIMSIKQKFTDILLSFFRVTTVTLYEQQMMQTWLLVDCDFAFVMRNWGHASMEMNGCGYKQVVWLKAIVDVSKGRLWSMVACWTAGQQVEWLILHQGHDS